MFIVSEKKKTRLVAKECCSDQTLNTCSCSLSKAFSGKSKVNTLVLDGGRNKKDEKKKRKNLLLVLLSAGSRVAWRKSGSLAENSKFGLTIERERKKKLVY